MEPCDPPPPEDVRAVLAAAAGGDGAALGRLLESHRPRLERMVGLRLDPRLAGRVDPDDVLQEAFAGIVDRFPEYLEKPDFDFYLWVRLETGQTLQQIHRRHLGVQARDVRREAPAMVRGVPGASSFALASAILAGSETPSRVLMEREREERLRAAIDGMKEEDREILVLRHFEQLSNQEAARVLELTESGASRRYLRAMGRLREILEALQVSSGIGRA